MVLYCKDVNWSKVLGTPENKEIVLLHLTFLVDPIINLISRPYYKYEGMKYHYLEPALGLGHLGHSLGPLTRETPLNFGAIFFFF